MHGISNPPCTKGDHRSCVSVIVTLTFANINENSARDKHNNLEPDEQSRNSMLVFPKALNTVQKFATF